MTSTGSMLKLAVLGDCGVGKTALVIQLCLNRFVETYDPTIEDSYRKRILLDNCATTLDVIDTAGQEEFANLFDQWIRDGEGFLLVYSVTERASFDHIMKSYEKIKDVKDEEPYCVVLVGNKVDLAAERAVTTQEGEEIAQQWGVPYYETSAKLNINTEVVFLKLARLTRDLCESCCSGHSAVVRSTSSGAQTPAVDQPGPTSELGQNMSASQRTHNVYQNSYQTVHHPSPICNLEDQLAETVSKDQSSNKTEPVRAGKPKPKPKKRCAVM